MNAANVPPVSAAPISAKVRGPRLAHRLIAHLSERIRAGAYAPGTRLPTEHEIMAEHGVSRAVVREAMSRLQAAGLVEARQGSGTFVLEHVSDGRFHIDPATIMTLGDVLALLEFRMSVETEAAYLAATRHTPEQLERIRECIASIQRHLETSTETKKLDFEFHLSVAAATGNRYFGELLNHMGLAILPRSRVDMRYIAGSHTREYLNRSNQEHRNICEAIGRRDADGARAAMRIHLSNSREHLRQIYEAAEAQSTRSGS